jgi:hypothetical protein
MKLRQGINLLEEREGMGNPAAKGDRVVYNVKMFLNQGDEVPLNERQAEHLPSEMIRIIESRSRRFFWNGRYHYVYSKITERSCSLRAK